MTILLTTTGGRCDCICIFHAQKRWAVVLSPVCNAIVRVKQGILPILGGVSLQTLDDVYCVVVTQINKTITKLYNNWKSLFEGREVSAVILLAVKYFITNESSF